jgi:hypothetical protein
MRRGEREDAGERGKIVGRVQRKEREAEKGWAERGKEDLGGKKKRVRREEEEDKKGERVRGERR